MSEKYCLSREFGKEFIFTEVFFFLNWNYAFCTEVYKSFIFELELVLGKADFKYAIWDFGKLQCVCSATINFGYHDRSVQNTHVCFNIPVRYVTLFSLIILCNQSVCDVVILCISYKWILIMNILEKSTKWKEMISKGIKVFITLKITEN